MCHTTWTASKCKHSSNHEENVYALKTRCSTFNAWTPKREFLSNATTHNTHLRSRVLHVRFVHGTWKENSPFAKQNRLSTNAEFSVQYYCSHSHTTECKIRFFQENGKKSPAALQRVRFGKLTVKNCGKSPRGGVRASVAPMRPGKEIMCARCGTRSCTRCRASCVASCTLLKAVSCINVTRRFKQCHDVITSSRDQTNRLSHPADAFMTSTTITFNEVKNIVNDNFLQHKHSFLKILKSHE